MNKNQKIMLALAGAGLMAACQAQAQIGTYNDNDLLLNFRNSSTDSGNDVEVDLGNIGSFLTTVGAGDTAVLDSGTGYNTSTFTTQFTGASLISTVGGAGQTDASEIGFSAAAENLSGTATPSTGLNTLWLTRQITSSQESTGGTASFQGSAAAQNKTAQDIADIGFEASSSGTGTALTGAGNAGVVLDSDTLSYHTLASTTASPDIISYNGNVTGTGTSPIDATPSSGTVYEALWEVPVSGAGSDTYEGFFTFNQNGEVDFTEASAVPEPSTYALLAATALLALVFRRQLRSLTA
jgi:hypothetical protein